MTVLSGVAIAIAFLLVGITWIGWISASITFLGWVFFIVAIIILLDMFFFYRGTPIVPARKVVQQ